MGRRKLIAFMRRGDSPWATGFLGSFDGPEHADPRRHV